MREVLATDTDPHERRVAGVRRGNRLVSTVVASTGLVVLGGGLIAVVPRVQANVSGQPTAGNIFSPPSRSPVPPSPTP